MRSYYKNGFALFRARRAGPVFIAPHSSTTLSPVLRGDVGSEIVTSRLVKSIGSFGVISTVPRFGKYGIGFYRESASVDEALRMFSAYKKSDYKAIQNFEAKYAFFARDHEEYLGKINTYDEFWHTVDTLSPKNALYVIVHSQALRLKNFPSILDIATSSGKWFDEKMVKNAVEKVGKRNEDFLKNVKPDLKDYALGWAKIFIKRSITYRFKRFDLKKLDGVFRTDVQKDMEKAAIILGEKYEDLVKDLNWAKYEEILEKCIDKTDFRITYQNIFTGRAGDTIISQLIRRAKWRALQVETSSFMNEMYPKSSAKFTEDIINLVDKQDKWKTLDRMFST